MITKQFVTFQYLISFVVLAVFTQSAFAQGRCTADPDTSLTGAISAESAVHAIKLAPQIAQVVQIEQTGSEGPWWSIAELKLFQSGSTTSLISAGYEEINSVPLNWKYPPKNALDAKSWTFWSPGKPQQPGQKYIVKLKQAVEVDCLELHSGNNAGDYPRQYEVKVWETLGEYYADEAFDDTSERLFRFPAQAVKYLRLTQTGATKDPSTGKGRWWGISELQVFDQDGKNKLASSSDTPWVASASHSASNRGETPNKAIDGGFNNNSTWTTGRPQEGGEYFQLDLGAAQQTSMIRVLSDVADKNRKNYPEGLALEVSMDGVNWYDPNTPQTVKPSEPVLPPIELDSLVSTPINTPSGLKVADEHWNAFGLVSRNFKRFQTLSHTVTQAANGDVHLYTTGTGETASSGSVGWIQKVRVDTDSSVTEVSNRIFPECKETAGITHTESGAIAALCRTSSTLADTYTGNGVPYTDLQQEYIDNRNTTKFDGKHDSDFLWLYEWPDGNLSSQPDRYIVSKNIGSLETGQFEVCSTEHRFDVSAKVANCFDNSKGAVECHETDRAIAINRNNGSSVMHPTNGSGYFIERFNDDGGKGTNGWFNSGGPGHTSNNRLACNAETNESAVMIASDGNSGASLHGLTHGLNVATLKKQGTQKANEQPTFLDLQVAMVGGSKVLKGGPGAFHAFEDGYIGIVVGAEGNAENGDLDYVKDGKNVEPLLKIGIAKFDRNGEPHDPQNPVIWLSDVYPSYASYPQLTPLSNGNFLLGYGVMAADHRLGKEYKDLKGDLAYPRSFWAVEIDSDGNKFGDPVQFPHGVGWGEFDKMVPIDYNRVAWAQVGEDGTGLTYHVYGHNIINETVECTEGRIISAEVYGLDDDGTFSGIRVDCSDKLGSVSTVTDSNDYSDYGALSPTSSAEFLPVHQGGIVANRGVSIGKCDADQSIHALRLSYHSETGRYVVKSTSCFNWSAETVAESGKELNRKSGFGHLKRQCDASTDIWVNYEGAYEKVFTSDVFRSVARGGSPNGARKHAKNAIKNCLNGWVKDGKKLNEVHQCTNRGVWESGHGALSGNARETDIESTFPRALSFKDFLNQAQALKRLCASQPPKKLELSAVAVTYVFNKGKHHYLWNREEKRHNGGGKCSATHRHETKVSLKGICDEYFPDSDNDGVRNDFDDFPNDGRLHEIESRNPPIGHIERQCGADLHLYVKSNSVYNHNSFQFVDNSPVFQSVGRAIGPDGARRNARSSLDSCLKGWIENGKYPGEMGQCNNEGIWVKGDGHLSADAKKTDIESTFGADTKFSKVLADKFAPLCGLHSGVKLDVLASAYTFPRKHRLNETPHHWVHAHEERGEGACNAKYDYKLQVDLDKICADAGLTPELDDVSELAAKEAGVICPEGTGDDCLYGRTFNQFLELNSLGVHWDHNLWSAVLGNVGADTNDELCFSSSDDGNSKEKCYLNNDLPNESTFFEDVSVLNQNKPLHQTFYTWGIYSYGRVEKGETALGPDTQVVPYGIPLMLPPQQGYFDTDSDNVDLTVDEENISGIDMRKQDCLDAFKNVGAGASAWDVTPTECKKTINVKAEKADPYNRDVQFQPLGIVIFLKDDNGVSPYFLNSCWYDYDGVVEFAYINDSFGNGNIHRLPEPELVCRFGHTLMGQFDYVFGEDDMYKLEAWSMFIQSIWMFGGEALGAATEVLEEEGSALNKLAGPKRANVIASGIKTFNIASSAAMNVTAIYDSLREFEECRKESSVHSCQLGQLINLAVSSVFLRMDITDTVNLIDHLNGEKEFLSTDVIDREQLGSLIKKTRESYEAKTGNSVEESPSPPHALEEDRVFDHELESAPEEHEPVDEHNKTQERAKGDIGIICKP